MSNATTIYTQSLAVKWAVEMGIMPEGTKWYAEKWEKGKVLQNMEERDCIGTGSTLWMRVNCTARRPDLTLEDED